MSHPLAVLGRFVFGLRTAPFDQLRRSTAQRIASNNRFGQIAAHQHLGPGDESITLSGTL
ncbi:MAG: oxidoreductase, partial [Halothiobacillaceae bacterium]